MTMNLSMTQSPSDKVFKLEYWYRFYDRRYAASADEYGDIMYGTGGIDVHLETYTVVKHTPKGVWLTYGKLNAVSVEHLLSGELIRCNERFVRHDAKKKYAHPTIEEALMSFQARKNMQSRIYTSKAQDAKDAYTLATTRYEQGYYKDA